MTERSSAGDHHQMTELKAVLLRLLGAAPFIVMGVFAATVGPRDWYSVFLVVLCSVFAIRWYNNSPFLHWNRHDR